MADGTSGLKGGERQSEAAWMNGEMCPWPNMEWLEGKMSIDVNRQMGYDIDDWMRWEQRCNGHNAEDADQCHGC